MFQNQLWKINCDQINQSTHFHQSGEVGVCRLPERFQSDVCFEKAKQHVVGFSVFLFVWERLGLWLWASLSIPLFCIRRCRLCSEPGAKVATATDIGPVPPQIGTTEATWHLSVAVRLATYVLYDHPVQQIAVSAGRAHVGSIGEAVTRQKCVLAKFVGSWTKRHTTDRCCTALNLTCPSICQNKNMYR